LQGDQTVANLAGKTAAVFSKSTVILACQCCQNFLHCVLVQNEGAKRLSMKLKARKAQEEPQATHLAIDPITPNPTETSMMGQLQSCRTGHWQRWQQRLHLKGTHLKGMSWEESVGRMQNQTVNN
jgi:hypothetical protein